MKELEISPELQIEINRAEWIQALRVNGHRQCELEPLLLISVNQCALTLVTAIGGPSYYLCGYKEIYKWLGIDGIQKGKQIWRDNDGGWTFAQIADAATQGRYW